MHYFTWKQELAKIFCEWLQPLLCSNIVIRFKQLIMMFYHPCLRSKEFSCETILALSLRQNVSFSIFRIPSYWEIGSRVTDSWHYVEKCQRKRFACCCYQKLRQTNFFKKTFGKYSQNWMLQSKDSTRQILTLRESPSSDMLQNKRKLLFSLGKSRGTLCIEVQVDVGWSFPARLVFLRFPHRETKKHTYSTLFKHLK